MAITYPHEILRTQLQAKYHIENLLNTNINTNINTSIITIIKDTYKKYGYIGFYQGFSISLVRSIPATIATFYIYLPRK